MPRILRNLYLVLANLVENTRDRRGQIASEENEDEIMVDQFHEQNSHQESSGTDCRECMEYREQLKELRATAQVVAEQVIEEEMARVHKQDSHQGSSGTDCQECIEYLKQLKSARAK